MTLYVNLSDESLQNLKALAELAGVSVEELARGWLEERLAQGPQQPKRAAPSLAELLSRVTPENIHPEVDFGPPVGEEPW